MREQGLARRVKWASVIACRLTGIELVEMLGDLPVRAKTPVPLPHLLLPLLDNDSVLPTILVYIFEITFDVDTNFPTLELVLALRHRSVGV